MIYVDHLKPCVPSMRWPYRHSAHLFADTEQELHNFARSIGLRRDWFQAHPRLDHYDLTYGKLKQALAKGALQVTDSEMVSHYKPPPKCACENCGSSPLEDSAIMLRRVNPVGELPVVWRCQNC